MADDKLDPMAAVREYLRNIGAKGGSATGARKARDPEHYRAMQLASAEARTRNAAEGVRSKRRSFDDANKPDVPTTEPPPEHDDAARALRAVQARMRMLRRWSR
jgi:hypothetical protein